MKIALTSLVAVAAAIVAVSPAAAVDFTQTVVLNSNGQADIGASHGTAYATGTTEVAGTTFSDTYNFVTTISGSAAAAAISITVSSVPNYLNLTTASLNGQTASFSSTIANGMRTYVATLMAATNVIPATNALVVNGSVIGAGGTYNGNVSVAAATGTVPEPATWGLMVLGFGAIGGALRTSRRKVVFA